jgi:NAD(P)-dependent dehydrogenase (short-subunit alcohol dehydrogenase family)
MKISGQTAIVTGGASGLGKACVEMLIKQGATVFIADIAESLGNRTAQTTGASFIRTDVRREDEVEALMNTIRNSAGVARILINCVGIAPSLLLTRREGPHSAEAFRMTLEANVVGTFLPVVHFAHQLREADPADGEVGVVVMTSSIAAYDGQVGQVAYAASKGAVNAMTLPMARDLARLKIRVATIAPGPFATPMMDGIPNSSGIPLGSQTPHPERLGIPTEFAALAAHIVENPMLNGEVIRLDGALRLGPQ